MVALSLRTGFKWPRPLLVLLLLLTLPRLLLVEQQRLQAEAEEDKAQIEALTGACDQALAKVRDTHTPALGTRQHPARHPSAPGTRQHPAPISTRHTRAPGTRPRWTLGSRQSQRQLGRVRPVCSRSARPGRPRVAESRSLGSSWPGPGPAAGARPRPVRGTDWTGPSGDTEGPVRAGRSFVRRALYTSLSCALYTSLSCTLPLRRLMVAAHAALNPRGLGERAGRPPGRSRPVDPPGYARTDARGGGAEV